ncbi:MAG: PorT family protein [Muribaculaceae bacterium]|nr:PorT family protein [Muribaculaceae bacterium]
MKHLLLPLILMLGCVAPAASAQDIFDSGKRDPYLGVRLGLDITCPTNVDYGGFKMDWYNPGAGFELGAVYNIQLWKNLYFEPGLNIYYSTMRGEVGTGAFPASETMKESVRRFGFRIPIRAGYSFDLGFGSISVFTGPRISLPLIGRYHAKVDKISESQNLYKDGMFMHRVDLGWQFGAGFTYDHWVFEISGTAGMLDMYKGPASMHDNGVDITFGYNF